MKPEYAKALLEAKEKLRLCCSVDYNNDLKIHLADQWFKDIITAALANAPVPEMPKLLTNPQ